MSRRTLNGFRFVLAVAGALAPAGLAVAGPLRVVATLPDLGAITQAVGGDDVSVTTLAKGPQDPHFVEARPSFIQSLHRADVFVVNGMELEIGWAPVLLRSARNAAVQPGRAGYVDASQAVEPLEVPTTTVDRSMGDVHPYGNPHYLTDPINGMRVAALIRDRLAALRPERADAFREREQAFRRSVVTALVGTELAQGSDTEALVAAIEAGRLDSFLVEHGRPEQLGGWLGAMRAHRGTRAVQDHLLWPYFARRFGLTLVDTLEPRPGIAPTTRHLAEVVAAMQADRIPIILSSPYIDVRHARWVAEQTGARVVLMSNQVGGRPGTDGYLENVDYNVRGVAGAL